ncbi:site-2 protease family protein, partial [bacterium]
EKCGDDTARVMGRITLNPLPHIDPVGTILLPLILVFTGSNFWIAWAKPVPINPNKFKHFSSDLLKVSLAGCTANFLTAVSLAFLIMILRGLGIGGTAAFINILIYGLYINIMLGIFNLIPIPPLDGSNILYSFLPVKAQEIFRRITPFGFLILIVLINTYFFRVIFSTIVSIIAQILLSFA